MSRGVAAPRRLRAPVVAGTFYPAEPAALRDTVDRLLTAATPPQLSGPPKAIIVPHAGYIYSGPIAATAYRAIEPRRHDIERVVLLGPAHRVLLRGMAIATVDAFATPLGEIPIDDEARQQALTFAGVVADDVPHADEHALEVQLPFLQRVIERDWTLVPFAVGRANAIQIADVLAMLWGGRETLVVVSSDLSHYYDSATANTLDHQTAAAIVACDVDSISTSDACGAHPIRGLLELSRRTGLDVEQLDLRNSGDTAGDRSKVVGYGAFAVR